ncbi:MAG: AAA family ATPase [Saprospiraceae bacterium]
MLISRQKEKEILLRALQSGQSELIAVIGRRRVGKTHLVSTVFAEKIRFETSGVQNASLREQLLNFQFQLKKTFGTLAPEQPLKSWQEAFFSLINCCEQNPSTYQNVLFFDELPWLASRRSGFLNALSFFWNTWAVKKKMIVVICGSAASWMIEKVVNDKGGLHNRITKRIDLQPFNLGETEMFLKERGVGLNRYQILQVYMAMGGIPHYLNEVVNGKSAMQNIEEICFANSGLLRREFGRLYPALFENAEHHIAIIRALAEKWSGMSRMDILKMTGLPDGGGTSTYLEELEASGFIASFPSLEKKKKEIIYRLTDEYSLFYLKFIDSMPTQGDDVWKHLSQTQTFKSWCGYAFESICLKHIPQIKKALGISGIYTEASSFYQKGRDGAEGVQVDLLLNRNDNSINLFEIKFHEGPYVFTRAKAEALRKKRALFQHYSQTRKHIFISFLSVHGILENEHSQGLVDNNILLSALFER